LADRVVGIGTLQGDARKVVSRSNISALMGPPRAMLRIDGDTPELAPEEEMPMFAMIAGYQYRSAATVPGDNTATDTVSLVDALHGQVGTRVRHVWVQRKGEKVSTLDLPGSAFTLLTSGDGDPWWRAAIQVSSELGVLVDVVSIDSAGEIADFNGHWASATGLPPGGAILVRPDAFIGWRSDGIPDDPKGQLQQALSRILAR
jgi:putative polyketide hydroxylase